MQAYLIAAIAELRQNVGAEHMGIAACDVDIQISCVEETVQRLVEGYVFSTPQIRVLDPRDHLDLVDEHVSPPPIGSQRPHMLVQCDGVPQRDGFHLLELDLDDIPGIHALRQQTVLEDGEEQVRLPASPDARHDLDHAVPSAGAQLLEIQVPLDLHMYRKMINGDKIVLDTFA